MFWVRLNRPTDWLFVFEATHLQAFSLHLRFADMTTLQPVVQQARSWFFSHRPPTQTQILFIADGQTLADDRVAVELYDSTVCGRVCLSSPFRSRVFTLAFLSDKRIYSLALLFVSADGDSSTRRPFCRTNGQDSKHPKQSKQGLVAQTWTISQSWVYWWYQLVSTSCPATDSITKNGCFCFSSITALFNANYSYLSIDHCTFLFWCLLRWTLRGKHKIRTTTGAVWMVRLVGWLLNEIMFLEGDVISRNECLHPSAYSLALPPGS